MKPWLTATCLMVIQLVTMLLSPHMPWGADTAEYILSNRERRDLRESLNGFQRTHNILFDDDVTNTLISQYLLAENNLLESAKTDEERQKILSAGLAVLPEFLGAAVARQYIGGSFTIGRIKSELLSGPEQNHGG